MEEKRKYPRFDIEAKIQAKKTQKSDKIKDAFVKNISAEGFCFYSKELFDTGDIVEIDIAETQMEKNPICVKGKVVWSYKNTDAKDAQQKDCFLTGVKVLGVRNTDEARFAMLYCERILAELKNYLRI
ncbi:MAG: PilZ domain-containing protein [Candidatus Omnitrophota bacterium]